MTPGSFFFKRSQLFFSQGVIILRRKITPGHYSTGVISLHYTGITLQSDEVDNSHRVGDPKNSRSGPRQIIARLKSVDVKFRLVKSHKQLKKHLDTTGIYFNEDLTKYRDKLLFLSRTLCRNNMIKQAWSSNGKIRVRDKSDRVHIVRQESDLVSFGHVISD